mmetsp:Transcript_40360/g.115968  ORF Transcript_40360/g.115968 Transcript_40360/m.115968 type:complete len:207 (+) Transcript_40360:2683-3303(+)
MQVASHIVRGAERRARTADGDASHTHRRADFLLQHHGRLLRIRPQIRHEALPLPVYLLYEHAHGLARCELILGLLDEVGRDLPLRGEAGHTPAAHANQRPEVPEVFDVAGVDTRLLNAAEVRHERTLLHSVPQRGLQANKGHPGENLLLLAHGASELEPSANDDALLRDLLPFHLRPRQRAGLLLHAPDQLGKLLVLDGRVVDLVG